MANFRRIKIPTAVDGRYDHNLDFVHLTTQDFFGLRVLRAVEVMPNADFDIDLSVTGKCEPLVLPTYANVSTKVNAFFVPFRTVFQNWNAFINDTKERLYSTTAVPVYTMGRLVSALMKHVVLNDPSVRSGFVDNEGVYSVNSEDFTGYLGDPSAKYDLHFVRDLFYGEEFFNPNGLAQDIQTLHYYLNLDANGRRIYNFMLGLGIKADIINFIDAAAKIVWHTSAPSDYLDVNGNPYYVPYYDGTVLSPGLSWSFPDDAWEVARINSGGVSWNEDDEPFDYNISFLPLACLAKVYSDWFTNSQFEYTVNVIEAIITTVEQSKMASSQDLERLFALIFNVTYDNDYFTSALVHPYGAGNTSMSVSNVGLPDEDYGTAYLDGSNDMSQSGTAYHSGNLVSQYIHTVVHRMQDFARRNLLAGIRPVDRWLARWGIHLDNAKVNRSIWLGEYEQQFQISTVTQTSSDAGAGKELGSYAAQMQSSTDRNGHFSFRNTDEFGMLIFTSVVVPHVGYFQGMDRHNFHIGLTDFFTPEFDSMDVQAIAEYELFAPSLYNPDAGAQKHEDVFGMTSRYAEYKHINDVVSGDYFFDSRNTGLDAWHLLRIIDGETVFSESFTFGNTDAEQYKRIFAVTRGGFDPFKMFYNFKVHANLPAHKLFDDYEYDKRGRETEINALGTKLN